MQQEFLDDQDCGVDAEHQHQSCENEGPIEEAGQVFGGEMFDDQGGKKEIEIDRGESFGVSAFEHFEAYRQPSREHRGEDGKDQRDDL